MRGMRVISLVFWISLYFNFSIAIPTSHLIQDVPYHRQENNFACGAASLQMALHYYGANVNQYTVMNVVRTAAGEGTLSLDLVRGAQFSALSSSIGVLDPTAQVSAGYPSHPLGYGAFHHDGEPWLESLKEIIASDSPVLILSRLSPNATTGGGHFRVVIGYDDNKEEVTMLNPWDRNEYTPVDHWPYSVFLRSWAYVEKDSPRSKPYFGIAISPWRFVDINTKQINSTKEQEDVLLTAKVTYPCHSIFGCSQFPADNSVVLLRPLTSTAVEVLSSQSLNIGVVKAGTTHEVQWTLRCRGRCQGQRVSLKGSGIIRGSLPPTRPYHSGYEYVDAIGGEASFTM